MKLTKLFLSALSIAALAAFSACSTPTANTPAVNNSNTATVASNSPKPSNTPTTPAVNSANNASNAKSPAAKTTPAASSGEAQKIEGRYQTGKTESLILYVGMETGDYAAYCFDNDSDAGRAIAAACKNGDECEVNAEMGEGSCKVPGLEADLSDSGRIAKVISAKSLGPAKKAK
jgi:hypothetical protein